MTGAFKTGLIFLLALLIRSSESRVLDTREAVERRTTTCNANGRTYKDGQEIVYHTVVSPILNAECSTCTCSAGSITGCNSLSCDIGYGGVVTPELCDNWITGIEGVCCPRCEACTTNAGPWAKTLSSGQCYECSCNGFSVQCSQTLCFGCPANTVPGATAPGKCCPTCVPQAATTEPSFTISLTTTQPAPVFPPGFPFRKKRDATSRDEQFYEEEYKESEH